MLRRDKTIRRHQSLMEHQRMRPDDLTIRPAAPGDFEGITALFNKGQNRLASPALPASVSKSVRQRLEGGDPNYFCLVAVFANEIVGQACLKRLDVKGLLTIIVDEAHRSCGIGTALLSDLIVAADQRLSLNSIEVDVFKDNDPALRLYRGLGFEVEERLAADDAVLTLSKPIR